MPSAVIPGAVSCFSDAPRLHWLRLSRLPPSEVMLPPFASTALTASSVVFSSKAAVASGLAKKLGIQKSLYAVENTRGGISKKSMIHNGATPDIEVDSETYEVRADGELLTCAPAEVLPMAQRYFMF